MPQSVLDAFSEEYDVAITYVIYDTIGQVQDNLAAGEIYDVVVIENDIVAEASVNKLLHQIDYANVPNFENIAPNFKDLVYDPGNAYSIPYNWGTTGLIVRTDLVDEAPMRWADLWDPQYKGQIALHASVPEDVIGMTLKSLGYSLQNENPDELAKAAERLVELRPNVVLVDDSEEDAIASLINGEVSILVGWAEDVFAAQEELEGVVYILPEEGTMLWGDSFVVPASSPNKYTAEVFLNYLLRPEVSVEIVNENFYATANEAAYPYIDEEILNNPVIFPNQELLANGEVYLPLSDEGTALWEAVWQEFIAEGSLK